MSDLRFERPVVLAGGLPASKRDAVREFALALNAPVHAEPLSGLREDERLSALLVTAGERMLARGSFDGVIRIGNVPTLRFWRDLDESLAHLPVISFSQSSFGGLTRGEMRSIDDLPPVTPRRRDEEFFRTDRRMAAEIEKILDDEPRSELAMMRELSRGLRQGARVYLGNSLPIREWDLVATRRARGYLYEGNRGANGIDGQLSTFFGWCAPGAHNVAVVGDLTTLYDLNAPWIVPQLDAAVAFQIVVVNNGGGRIFSRVAALQTIDRRLIENVHGLTFEKWAAMWDLAYNDRSAARSVIELLPDQEATERVWKRYDALWS